MKLVIDISAHIYLLLVMPDYIYFLIFGFLVFEDRYILHHHEKRFIFSNYLFLLLCVILFLCVYGVVVCSKYMSSFLLPWGKSGGKYQIWTLLLKEYMADSE